MHRYLLLDSGCSQCTEIAQAVEQATQGGLEARSLRDPTMQRLLAQARPRWRWQPALLEVEGDRVRAFTGLAMGLRLMGVLGLRRVWRLAKLVRRLSAPLASAEPTNPERRRFLQQLAAVIFMLGWPQSWILNTHRPEVPFRVEPADEHTHKLMLQRAQEDSRVHRLAAHLSELGFLPKSHPKVLRAFHDATPVRIVAINEYTTPGSGRRAELAFGVEASGEAWAYALVTEGTKKGALVVDDTGAMTWIEAPQAPTQDWDCIICNALCGGLLCTLGCGAACVVICGGNPYCAVICAGICGTLCSGACTYGCKALGYCS
jgi:hypothetical protein